MSFSRICSRNLQLIQSTSKCSYSTTTTTTTTPVKPNPLSDKLRETMRSTSQPVSVVSVHIPSSSSTSSSSSSSSSSSLEDNHGATLSSLSSVSLKPPIIAFSIRTPSRLATYLTSKTNPPPQLTVNLLSATQREVAQVFSRQPLEKYSYFSPSQESEMWKEQQLNSIEFPSLAFKSLKETSLARIKCEVASFTSLRSLGEGNELDEDEGKGSILFLAKVKEIENGEVGKRGFGALVYYEGEYDTVSDYKGR